MALSAEERRNLLAQIQQWGPISAADARAFLRIFKQENPNSTVTLADIMGFRPAPSELVDDDGTDVLLPPPPARGPDGGFLDDELIAPPGTVDPTVPLPGIPTPTPDTPTPVDFLDPALGPGGIDPFGKPGPQELFAPDLGTPNPIASPFVQYLQRVGLDTFGGGLGGNFKRNVLFPRTQDLFQAEGLFGIGGVRDTGPGDFTNFLNTRNPSSLRDIDQRSREILSGLLSQGAQERAARGLTFAQNAVTDAEGRRSPDPLSVPLAQQQSLINSALRQRLGPIGARHVTNNLGRLQDQFQLDNVNSLNPNQTGGFLDYLNSRYNLGGLN